MSYLFGHSCIPICLLLVTLRLQTMSSRQKGCGAFCPPRYETTKPYAILLCGSPVQRPARRGTFEVPAPLFKICVFGLTPAPLCAGDEQLTILQKDGGLLVPHTLNSQYIAACNAYGVPRWSSLIWQSATSSPLKRSCWVHRRVYVFFKGCIKTTASPA